MTNRMLVAIALGAIMTLMVSLYLSIGAKVIETAKPLPSKVVTSTEDWCFDCKWPVKEVNRVDPTPATVPWSEPTPTAPRVTKGTGGTTAPAALPARSLPAITQTQTSTVVTTQTQTRTNNVTTTGSNSGTSQLGTPTGTTHRARSTVMGTQCTPDLEGSFQGTPATDKCYMATVQPDIGPRPPGILHR